jgi:hypothetical protein
MVDENRKSIDRVWRGVRWGLFLSVIVGWNVGQTPAAAPARKPEGRAATKPSAPDPKATAAVNAAVAALVKEAQAGMKEGGSKDPTTKLREKADYFGDAPPAEITPDAVLAVLEKPMSSDPRADAYVKWQLLAAVHGQFTEEQGPRALAAYRKAPEPYSHPGLDRNKLTGALFKVGAMNRDNEGNVNKEFQAAIDKFTTDNLYILHYRDDLYARLPLSAESLKAGVDDMYVRVRHGVNSSSMFAQVGSSIRSWSLLADRRQLGGVDRALGTLLQTVKDVHCQPFTRVAWGDNPMGLHWEGGELISNADIQSVIDAVREAGRR